MKKPVNKRALRKRRSTKSGEWNRQAGILVRTIKELHKSPSCHGLKWKHNMIHHNVMMYQQLCRNIPSSSRSMWHLFNTTLAPIIELYKDKR